MITKTVLVAALATVLALTTVRAADITPAESKAIAKARIQSALEPDPQHHAVNN